MQNETQIESQILFGTQEQKACAKNETSEKTNITEEALMEQILGIEISIIEKSAEIQNATPKRQNQDRDPNAKRGIEFPQNSTPRRKYKAVKVKRIREIHQIREEMKKKNLTITAKFGRSYQNKITIEDIIFINTMFKQQENDLDKLINENRKLQANYKNMVYKLNQKENTHPIIEASNINYDETEYVTDMEITQNMIKFDKSNTS